MRSGSRSSRRADDLPLGLRLPVHPRDAPLCSARISHLIPASPPATPKALSEGARDFAALACVTKDGGPSCGACRQLLAEYCPADMPVVFATETAIVRETTVRAMMPFPFVLA